jgi:hypothetical protein
MPCRESRSSHGTEGDPSLGVAVGGSWSWKAVVRVVVRSPSWTSGLAGDQVEVRSRTLKRNSLVVGQWEPGTFLSERHYVAVVDLEMHSIGSENGMTRRRFGRRP